MPCAMSEDHYAVARGRNNLAWVLQDLGELATASDNGARAVASHYGQGLWFSTRTPFSIVNGQHRARRRKSLSSSLGSRTTRTFPPKSAMGQAISYARNRGDTLTRFLARTSPAG